MCISASCKSGSRRADRVACFTLPAADAAADSFGPSLRTTSPFYPVPSLRVVPPAPSPRRRLSFSPHAAQICSFAAVEALLDDPLPAPSSPAARSPRLWRSRVLTAGGAALQAAPLQVREFCPEGTPGCEQEEARPEARSYYGRSAAVGAEVGRRANPSAPPTFLPARRPRAGIVGLRPRAHCRVAPARSRVAGRLRAAAGSRVYSGRRRSRTDRVARVTGPRVRDPLLAGRRGVRLGGRPPSFTCSGRPCAW